MNAAFDNFSAREMANFKKDFFEIPVELKDEFKFGGLKMKEENNSSKQWSKNFSQLVSSYASDNREIEEIFNDIALDGISKLTKLIIYFDTACEKAKTDDYSALIDYLVFLENEVDCETRNITEMLRALLVCSGIHIDGSVKTQQ